MAPKIDTFRTNPSNTAARVPAGSDNPTKSFAGALVQPNYPEKSVAGLGVTTRSMSRLADKQENQLPSGQIPLFKATTPNPGNSPGLPLNKEDVAALVQRTLSHPSLSHESDTAASGQRTFLNPLLSHESDTAASGQRTLLNPLFSHESDYGHQGGDSSSGNGTKQPAPKVGGKSRNVLPERYCRFLHSGHDDGHHDLGSPTLTSTPPATSSPQMATPTIGPSTPPTSTSTLPTPSPSPSPRSVTPPGFAISLQPDLSSNPRYVALYLMLY